MFLVFAYSIHRSWRRVDARSTSIGSWGCQPPHRTARKEPTGKIDASPQNAVRVVILQSSRRQEYHSKPEVDQAECHPAVRHTYGKQSRQDENYIFRREWRNTDGYCVGLKLEDAIRKFVQIVEETCAILGFGQRNTQSPESPQTPYTDVLQVDHDIKEMV